MTIFIDKSRRLAAFVVLSFALRFHNCVQKLFLFFGAKRVVREKIFKNLFTFAPVCAKICK
jgi:hypothetical protein